MRVPISWIKDFVDIDLDLEILARQMTMIGLEVEEIHLVGLPKPESERHEFKYTGISWAPETIVVAQVDEVMPHPNADRLVLCRLQDGEKEHIVLTGAPNLYPYKGQGPLDQPLKVAYAKEGARIYDGHQPGLVLTKLKKAKIRGVESYSMICSEKELGISDEHEGVIILDDDAPTGTPLADYMGDAVFDIAILPNMVRCASIVGMARELAALTSAPLRQPELKMPANGPTVKGQVSIDITVPELNPRFVFGLIRNVETRPSPYNIQRRLRLAGMRPIDCIVDATNYAMLELGEPLHAFDYDILVERAGGKTPTIITRTAQPGEKLVTLDEVERELHDFTVLVTDTKSALALAGVMGGLESEVTSETRNVLLEGANWNLVNTRRTATAHKLSSEAGYRFARGVHPELAPQGVSLGLEYMARWSSGQIAADLVDEYPAPAVDPVLTVTPENVRRSLGVEITPARIAELLSSLEFDCTVEGDQVTVRTPPHRLDIGVDAIGVADLMEEVARTYSYDNITKTRLADPLPPQHNNPPLEKEEKLRDLLVALGMQEIVSYRLTTPEREARAYLAADAESESVLPYVVLKNPISAERSHMRRSVLASVLEAVERSIRLAGRLALFEIGPAFFPLADKPLPAEKLELAMAVTGRRAGSPHWQGSSDETLDFYDLKGVIEALLDGLHVPNLRYEVGEHPSFHPGKCARVLSGEAEIGVFGDLHPLVKERYDFDTPPVLAAVLDMEALLAVVPPVHTSRALPTHPPVLEDIAIIVDDNVTGEQVETVIRQGGGKLLAAVRLFDIYYGEQIGAGKKSLAYNLTYQAEDRTLTDKDAAKIRNKIIKNLERVLNAQLRSE
jgi:phenylalanyl-tRNA synthetase beta chain